LAKPSTRPRECRCSRSTPAIGISASRTTDPGSRSATPTARKGSCAISKESSAAEPAGAVEPVSADSNVAAVDTAWARRCGQAPHAAKARDENRRGPGATTQAHRKGRPPLPATAWGAPRPSYPQGPALIWCSHRGPRQARHMQVALITDLGAITEECARVAESLGVMLTVLPPDSGGWQSASLILLGEDVREAPVTDRADRILV